MNKFRGSPDDFVSLNTSGYSMNYAHINARSIPAHIDELKYILSCYDINILGVCETFLKRGQRKACFAVEGYQIYRNDRVGACGGVAIYVRKGIKANIISRSESSRIEYILLELCLCGAKILVGEFYIPPPTTKSDVDHLNSIISEFFTSYPHAIYMGDFNINLLDIRKSRYYLSILSSLSLCYIPFAATRVDSLLDHVLISECNTSKILKFAQLPLPGISDHDMVLLTYNHRVPKQPVQFKLVRDLSGVDMNCLVQSIHSIPWSVVFGMSNCNDQVEFITDAINLLFNNNVPVKRVIERMPSVPWFNSNILYWIKKRDAAYRTWRITKLENDRKNFTFIRNKVVRLVRDAKRKLFLSKFNRVSNSQQAWLTLKKLGYENKVNDECNYLPDDLNKHFTTITNTSPFIPLPDNRGYQDEDESFSFITVTEEEVYKAFYSISSDTAGIDCISLNFLKVILPYILQYITHIINFCIVSCSFPDKWKKALVIPVSKKLSPSLMTDFRPISLLSVLSKGMEILMRNQIQNYLDSRNLLMQYQSGFRKNHSTTTALAKVTYDVMQGLNNSNFTVLILLDFSKAFDSVDHMLLCQKLHFHFHFSRQAVRLVSSYLTERSQIVKTSAGVSSERFVLSGVPQGSILGPLLFSMFIDDLPRMDLSSSCHLYADDCQIYISGKFKNIDHTFKLLNSDLCKISNWSHRNGLMLNPKKTQAILFSKMKVNMTLPQLWLNDTSLEFSDSVRNLGVIFNSSLNWSDHINSICNKVHFVLHSLRQLSFYTPTKIKMLLVKSLLVPLFTYCDILFFNPDYNSRRHLQVAFNSCIRYVYNLRRYDHVSAYSDSVLGIPLFTYLNFRVCCFIFKLILLRQPCYLSSLLAFGSSSRTFNITSLCDRNSSRQFVASLFVHGFSLFNNLPMEVKCAGSMVRFKSLCYTYFQGGEL